MKFSFLLTLLATSAMAAEKPARSETSVVLDATGVKNLGVETVAAEEAAFERTVFVLGEIEHTCESHAVLSSRVAGRIVEVLQHKGDFVKKGELLVRVESRQPGDPPPVIELKAPADGLIVESEAHLGAPVEPDQELMEILDLSTVWVNAKVPQHHAALLAEGLAATVRVPALGDGEREAKYLRLGVGADAAKGSVDALFELPNPGNQLRPGMRAELSLVASKRDGVLSVPREALQGDRSGRFVFIKDYELENTFVRTPVTVGEISGDRVEIVGGLFPGDEVVTRGAYALSFAGKGNTSLKEALDAAHGHPHNEDGTEMTKEQIAASGEAGGHDRGHAHAEGSPLVLFLSIACGVLFVLLLASPFVFRGRRAANAE
jgi:multidrug efflux pump subunit AcrA (membrane-fusion protein)